MPNNQTKPNQTQTTPLGAGGVNRVRVEVPSSGKSSWTARATERTPMREVYANELAWAEKYLPDEYGPFVALAIESVKRRGLKPSTGSVMEHLRALGRDAESRRVA